MPITDMKININGQMVSLPEGFDDYIDWRRAAVVELDMHGGHLDPGPECPAGSPRGREIIEDINRFNQACRELGIPVIHVVNTYRAGDFEGVESGWRRMTEGHYSMLPEDKHPTTKYYGNLGLENSIWSTLFVENKPEDIVVDTKKRVTAFETTDLDLVLRALDKDVLVITGIMTNCCDLCSAYYAGSKDYKVIFCFDMTRGSNPSDEAAAGLMVSRYIGLNTNSDELLREWAAQKSAAEAL
jgi:nicotinamidase-related amidase